MIIVPSNLRNSNFETSEVICRTSYTILFLEYVMNARECGAGARVIVGCLLDDKFVNRLSSSTWLWRTNPQSKHSRWHRS